MVVVPWVTSIVVSFPFDPRTVITITPSNSANAAAPAAAIKGQGRLGGRQLADFVGLVVMLGGAASTAVSADDFTADSILANCFAPVSADCGRFSGSLLRSRMIKSANGGWMFGAASVSGCGGE